MGLRSGRPGDGEARLSAAATVAPTIAAGLTIAELERVFWHCNWSATASALDADTFTACAAAADELKARKFDGDRLGDKMALAEKLLDRGVLAGDPGSPDRAIKRDRQPGLCCDQGCSAQG